jgi:thioredoxin 1
MVVKLLYFSAEWCGPCKTQSPIVDEVKENYEESVNIVKIDIDDSPDIGTKYQVRSLPTVIVLTEDEDGSENLQERFVGVTQQNDLEEALDEALDSE